DYLRGRVMGVGGFLGMPIGALVGYQLGRWGIQGFDLGIGAFVGVAAGMGVGVLIEPYFKKKV
ncbi:MAG: hypothetical protein Q8L24_00245, partial [bacterium]|nr:hypothetical protein [bacterium]